ncbi:MAG: energy-coupling factor ABC transporter permease [Candidatus Riflebacteria bacterium]|nr:energy-coupling factor ABC transporter permease [Candidatus Riflebacteria bacterium]
MHMADALVSPAVGMTFCAVSAGFVVYASRKVSVASDDMKAPLMGILGAFIFAAQMINFSIPGTGSSGHLGGGLILAALLGKHAAAVTMASVLFIQAFMFADGGLLALGCNIFNLAVIPCYVAYPFIFQKLISNDSADISQGRINAASVVASIVALQFGAFAVVMQTYSSEVSELPFFHFLLLMQPIHFAIGIVEGLATSSVVSFVWKNRPELLSGELKSSSSRSWSVRKILYMTAFAAIFTGAVLSWFASSAPDGLEWSTMRVSGKEELNVPDKPVYSFLAAIQSKLALFPDYKFRISQNTENTAVEAWPEVNAGTSISGLAGGLSIVLLMVLFGKIVNRKSFSLVPNQSIEESTE